MNFEGYVKSTESNWMNAMRGNRKAEPILRFDCQVRPSVKHMPVAPNICQWCQTYASGTKHTPVAACIRQWRKRHTNGGMHTPTAFHIKAQGRDSAPWVRSSTANPVPQRGSTYTCGTPLGYEPRGTRHIPTCAIATLGFGIQPRWGKALSDADAASIQTYGIG